MSDNVNVKFGGDTGDFDAAVQHVKVELGNLGKLAAEAFAFNEVKEAFNTLKDSIEGIINSANKAVDDVFRLQQRMGSSAEAASALRIALNSVGMTTDDYLTIIQKVDRQVRTNEQSYEALGVKVRDGNGDYLSQQQILDNVTKKLLEYKVGTDRNQASMVLLGGRVGDLNGLLRMNQQRMEEAAKTAKDLNLVFGNDSQNAMHAYQESMAKVDEVILSLKVQLAQQLEPSLTGLANWLSTEGPTAVEFFKSAIQGVLVTVTLLTTGIETLVIQFKRLKAGAFDFSDASPAEKMRNYQNTLKELDGELKKVEQDGKKAYMAIFGLDENGNPIAKPTNNDAPIPTGSKSFAGDPKLIAEAAKKAADEQKAIGEDYLRTDMELSRIGFQDKKSTLDQEVALGQITEQQKIVLLKDYVNQEYEANQAMLEDQINNDKLTLLEKEKLGDQMEILEAKHRAEVDKLDRQSLIERKKQYDEFFGAINRAFSSSIQGILQGTQTWRQALANVFTNILASFADMLEQMAMKWLENALFSQFVSKSEGATNIQTSAAQAGAAAYSSTASIPVIGPELAPAAAYAAYAGALSFQGLLPLATGAWDVPTDMPAYLHEGEMVVPKTFAESMREEGGVGGGMNVHIHATDAQSFANLMQSSQGRKAIVDVISKETRGFNSKMSDGWK